MNVPHSRKAKAIFVAPGGSEQDILKEGTVFFEDLLHVRKLLSSLTSQEYLPMP